MQKLCVSLAAGLLGIALVASPASARVPLSWLTTGDALETGGTIFAGGGTFVSNGTFFPGTLACDGNGDCQGLPPIQLKKGTDLEFVNLDPAAVTNGHQIISYKRKRGQPLFSSKQVDGPARAVVITSHLKPGVYQFFCGTHFGMEAHLEVVP